MTRHKKFLKSEKTKTKLKGAKLPKGLNVTKTEFKVRKIVIRDQIKEQPTLIDGTVLRSSIKDLLSKLQHHNAVNRNDGLKHLKEIITNHPQETSKHLGAMLQGICQLALDIEKDVRRECFKALNLVFASQTPDLIAPFVNVITSYLRCAMTHINIQIQEDSLSLLDCLLLYAPTLVATNSDTIFTCFLDMISKMRTESNPQRTLTVHLGRKQTNVKWRSKVLDRLLGILKAIVENRKQVNQQINITDELISSNRPVDDAFELPINVPINVNLGRSPRYQSKQIHFAECSDSHFSIVHTNLNQNCDLPLLFRKTSNAIMANASNLLIERDEVQKIQKYIDLLMPLLFETWMEVRPPQLNSSKPMASGFDDEDVCISNEAAAALKTIMEIIEQLLELIKLCDHDVNGDDLIKWFRRKYSQEFFTLFLNGFPYQQGDGFKGSKRKSKGMATEHDVHEAGGQKCIYQNLNIAFVYWILRTNSPANQISTKKIINFIKDNMVVSLIAASSDIHQAICKVLHCILVENGAQQSIDTVSAIRMLLATVLETYHHGLFPKEIRTRIMIMLCDIVLDNKLYAAYGEEQFINWLSTLPKLLCQPYISAHTLKTFSHLARQKNPHFMKHLDVNQVTIIGNLPHVQITGLENQSDGKQEIINLFYWLTKWQPDQSEANQMHLSNEWPMINKLLAIKK